MSGELTVRDLLSASVSDLERSLQLHQTTVRGRRTPELQAARPPQPPPVGLLPVEVVVEVPPPPPPPPVEVPMLLAMLVKVLSGKLPGESQKDTTIVTKTLRNVILVHL